MYGRCMFRALSEPVLAVSSYSLDVRSLGSAVGSRSLLRRLGVAWDAFSSKRERRNAAGAAMMLRGRERGLRRRMMRRWRVKRRMMRGYLCEKDEEASFCMMRTCVLRCREVVSC